MASSELVERQEDAKSPLANQTQEIDFKQDDDDNELPSAAPVELEE